MDIKTLQIYLDLSKRLHFTHTAQAMHMSPSALSRTIQRLEEELNVTLFRRNNRTVSLTRAGYLFLDYARQTVSDYYKMNQSMDSLRLNNDSLTGELTLFCTVTAAHIFVPGFLNIFRRRYPNADLKLITGDASQAWPHVRDAKVDFAFAVESEHFETEFVFQRVDDINCSLIAPMDSANFSHLLEQDTIPWERLPFVMPESGPLRTAMQEWFQSMHINPDVYAQVTGHEAIVSMTSLGCGLSIIPDPVLDLSPLKSTVRTISTPVPPPTLVLGIVGLKKRLNTPLMRAFWALAEEVFEQQVKP